MIDTPEKAEARQRVAAAIQAFAALDMVEDDQFVGDWAVVAHMPRVNESGEDEYLLVFPSAYTPSHIAQGLFSTGADVAGSGWTPKDDDE